MRHAPATTHIDVFREALLADAQNAANETLAAAARDAEQRLEEAQRQGHEILEQARAEGRAVAERETRRERVAARRQARSLVLQEQRLALERLRAKTLERARASASSEAYTRLIERLERQARRQLGDEVQIERDADAGGLVAHCDRRVVDYRLPRLVDLVIESAGAELEELWQ